MVIYNSEDSDNMMQSLSANIKTAKAIFDKMTQGTRHLEETIDSGALSGAAYNAGKNLFLAYIFPMVKKLDAAIMDIQNDLNSYKSADQEIRSVGNYLNEDELRAMLSNTNKLIQLLEKKIEEDKKYIQKLISLHFEDLVQGLAELPRLEQQLDNLKDLKRDYEKKLQALQNFASTTAPLFKDSIQAFEYALQGVDAINQSSANADGTIIFPAGVSKNWLENLKNEKFSSKLEKIDKKAHKVPKIEIRKKEISLGVEGTTETIYEVYVDGVLDEDRTLSYNWMITKQQISGTLHFIGEFVLVNDIYALVTGKDWLSGDNSNRLEAAGWLALTLLPVAKLSKIVKELKAGNKLLKGVDLSSKDLKILRDSGYFEEVGQKSVAKSEKLIDSKLMSELKESGVKYNADEVIMTTKEPSGKLDWLENGNNKSGLQHILEGHEKDFINKGIKKEEIPGLLKRALSDGKVIGYQGRGTGRPIYEVSYNGNKYRIAITVGENGYIVGANPR